MDEVLSEIPDVRWLCFTVERGLRQDNDSGSGVYGSLVRLRLRYWSLYLSSKVRFGMDGQERADDVDLVNMSGQNREELQNYRINNYEITLSRLSRLRDTSFPACNFVSG